MTLAGILAKSFLEDWIKPYLNQNYSEIYGVNAFTQGCLRTQPAYSEGEFGTYVELNDHIKLLSNGNLSPVTISVATYNAVDGAVNLTTGTDNGVNGAADDEKHYAILKKTTLEALAEGVTPKIDDIGGAWPLIGQDLRSDANALFTIPEGLTATDLVAYVWTSREQDQKTFASDCAYLAVSAP